jgi:NADPH2:quinone reductase
MHAIQVTETGGPESLRWTELPDPTAGPGQVVVELSAAGLNYIDTYHRSGLYPQHLPFVAGLEGAGSVLEIGPGVDRFTPGDRVAWSTCPGSYAERVTVPTELAVPIPDGVSDQVAAGVMLQGMTAHYLVSATFPLEPGHRCLIHAAAGGVGLLLVQMAKIRGAEVFATVGTAEKARLATGAGADHVIRYRDDDFVAAIEQVAGSRPIDVVYDGVGAATFDGGLAVLRRRGTMVVFGNASGPVDPVSPLALSSNGSLYLTRPTLFDHLADRDELEERAGEVFRWIVEGRLDVRIGERIPLRDAARAHELLESRRTTGKVLLLP